MRTILASILLTSIPVATGACGGATDVLGGGGGGDAGLTDGGDGGKGDGGGAGSDGGSGTDCTSLAAEIATLQAKAQECCATCDIVQCTKSVNGLCCPVSVNIATSQATQAFVAAVQQYQAACVSMCPAIVCQAAPSGICDGTSTTGECR
jgi:hypothetical protein